MAPIWCGDEQLFHFNTLGKHDVYAVDTSCLPSYHISTYRNPYGKIIFLFPSVKQLVYQVNKNVLSCKAELQHQEITYLLN